MTESAGTGPSATARGQEAADADRVAQTLASLAGLSLDFSDLDGKVEPPKSGKSSVVAETPARAAVASAANPSSAEQAEPPGDVCSTPAASSEKTAQRSPEGKKRSSTRKTPDSQSAATQSGEATSPRGSRAARRASAPPPISTPHLVELFERVEALLGDRSEGSDEFTPKCPQDINETGLLPEEVERLILKFLLAKGACTGRGIAAQIRLPFAIVDPLLKGLRRDQLLTLLNSAEMGDYVYGITDLGRERARRYMDECTYFGAAPVVLKDYLHAMQAQSIAGLTVTEDDLREAFADLLINQEMLERLGPAINSGRGMFLYGEPGNGKTSIAERITQCFGSTIWIPRTLGVDGDIIRLFDPGVHEEVAVQQNDGLFDLSGVDPRWVRIVRPTVVAGGELTMAELEVTLNQTTRICEAPLQLKSNCGTLVIDDFGRQRMPVAELLNRWIVPLEKRYDFLNLPSGKKVQVPFDQLIIFSTNLEPRDLVDGAFLRRIPYKIKVPDPTQEEFKEIIRRVAPKMGFQYDEAAVDYLVKTHYLQAGRPFRACQPRDLLLQVKNYCAFRQIPKRLTPAAFDFAVANYFSIM
jgi:predicted ATPase with chaperone activity